MIDDTSDDNQTAEKRDPGARRKRWLKRVAIVAAVAFYAVVAWNLIDSVGESTPSKPPANAESAAADEAISVAAVGDIGSDEKGRSTLRAMAAKQPDVHLALGDLSYAGAGSEERWCELVRSILGPVAPIEIVAGNHEEDTGDDGHITNFTECLPDRLEAAGEYGKQYYFDLGTTARFIMISPDLTIDGGHYYYGEDNANIQWLGAAIDEAREAGIQWVVVGTHKNCISVGEYFCAMYQDLFSFLIEKKVDLVLTGHDHTYQRSKQLAAPSRGCDAVIIDRFDQDCVVDDGADHQYERGRGTVFVVSGAGGGRLYDVHADDPEAGYFAATMGANKNPRHGFAMLRITSSRLAVEFLGSSQGSFTDEFSVVRSRR
jgi:hypothetical protein